MFYLQGPMLLCIPQSIFSWDFRIEGEKLAGEASFQFFSEQGSIRYGSEVFEVVKHGWTSGHWTLEQGGAIVAEARKPSPFARAFEVADDVVALGLAAQSPFTRCYDLRMADRVIGSIRPEHPFTRRAMIDCEKSVPEVTQIFCFWLAALTWRRAKKNNA